MRRLILLGIYLLSPLAAAQTPGLCTLGTAQADLATPDLLARVFNTGSLFYGNGSFAYYLVPRIRSASPVYAAGLWLGGRVGGEVRTAGGTYGAPSIPFTFWPGPLDAGAALPDPADCSAYDRIWVASPADVAAYEAGAIPAVDLREWPVGLGAPAVDAQGLPVPIGSREQRIDLPGGERPVLGGGPTAFWVMNDVGNSHGPDGSAPLGVEVRVTAFSPAAGPLAFRQATVYRYAVVNRNAIAIDDFQAGIWSDPDLGDASDDLSGSDTTRGMAYLYNEDDEDGDGTGASYGAPAPAVGIDVLSSRSWASSHFTGQGGQESVSSSAEQLNRLRGLWSDSTEIRTFGDGYMESQGDVTRFTYPGDPVTSAFWSEGNTGTFPNVGGDRQVMLSTPPVTLAPGATYSFDVAFVFAQGEDHIGSITALRAASDQIQAAYDAGTLVAGPFPEGTAAAPALIAPADGGAFPDQPVLFSWQPVAGAERYVLEVGSDEEFSIRDVDVVYGTSVTLPANRFEPNRTAPLYWRVRSVMDGLDGLPSTARSFTAYRFVGAPLTLGSGALAVVETTAPGGGAACDGSDDPDEGCAEVDGDLVLGSLNSTGDYVLISLTPNGASVPGSLAPDDFEIRFTETGSVAIGLSGPRLFRVPFELWNVGVVAPGTANDPADDRQLIAYVSSVPADICAFDYSLPTRTGVGPASPFLRGYFPVDDDYAAYAEFADAAVAADPAGCPTGAAAMPALGFRDSAAGLPFSSLYLEQAGSRSITELAGSTVRFYTVDRVVASETPAGAAGALALALGAPFPNPALGRVAVPYAVAAAGPVRLRVVDVLGRTVAVLADGAVAAGTYEAMFDARRLAAGVYALVLDGGTARAVRTLTVVR